MAFVSRFQTICWRRESSAITNDSASLICGIVGIFFCGVILGPVAIVLALNAKREIRESPGRYTGEGLATAGLVLGIVAVVAFVVGIIVVLAT